MGKLISRFGSEKVILNELGEPMFRRCITADGKTTQDFPVTERGFTKTLDVNVILRREYFSERDYTHKVAYLVQKYHCKMPKDRDLRLCYFKYDPKIMQIVCIRNFDNGTAWSIEVMNPENQKLYGIKAVGKPKRITPQKAKVLLREKEALGLFNDNGENRVFA